MVYLSLYIFQNLTKVFLDFETLQWGYRLIVSRDGFFDQALSNRGQLPFSKVISIIKIVSFSHRCKYIYQHLLTRTLVLSLFPLIELESHSILTRKLLLNLCSHRLQLALQLQHLFVDKSFNAHHIRVCSILDTSFGRKLGWIGVLVE